MEVLVERKGFSFFGKLRFWFFREFEDLEAWHYYGEVPRGCSILGSGEGLGGGSGGWFWGFEKSTKIDKLSLVY